MNNLESEDAHGEHPSPAYGSLCSSPSWSRNRYILEHITYVIVDIDVFFLATDYIRTFTWDKKLEMVVKSTGILGGQGKARMKERLLCLFFTWKLLITVLENLQLFHCVELLHFKLRCAEWGKE